MKHLYFICNYLYMEIEMWFIYSFIENGWTVKKRNNAYIFRKKGKEGKRLETEFMETYLRLKPK